MAEPTIDARELKAFAKALRAAKPDSPEWVKEFGRINRRAGEIITTDAAGRLRGPRGARAGSAIKPSASTAGIRVRVVNTGAAPHALADIFGTKRRTGWYGAQRYQRSSGRQHPPWIGNSWQPGDAGEGPGRGPYGLGPAIHDRLDDVMRDWTDAVEDLMSRFKSR